MKRYLILLLFISSINLYSENNTLKWSSYIGGNNNDEITSVKTDEFGNYYILGITSSTNYPTTANAFQKYNNGQSDIFITKFDKNNNIIWSTYLGGRAADAPHNFIITKNAIWVIGESVSTDYPITNDAITNYFMGGSGDIIVAKFSLEGTLLFSSYFGGRGYDAAADLTVDNEENVWITGRTNSDDFRTTNDAIKNSLSGNYDSFLLKISSNGQLLYSSLLGGNLSDYGLGISYSEKLNQIALIGFTDSGNYPIVGNALQNNKIGSQDEFDGYISIFSQKTKLIWSSFLGGFGNDYPFNIAFDQDGNLILRCYTTSSNLPVSANAFQRKLKGTVSNYLLKISPDKDMVWATYFGGSLTDGADNFLHKFGGITIDSKNNILITGYTNSSDFPITPNAYSPTKSSGNDCYFSEFNKDGELLYSSFLGGQNYDEGRSIIVNNNDIIVTGWTLSNDFPISDNAFAKNLIGAKDCFISIFGASQPSCIPLMDSEVGFTNLNLKTNRTISDDSYVHLTDFISYDNGYMFSKKQVNVSYGFVSNFSFTVSDGVVKIEHSDLKSNELQSDNSLPGADGIAFIIAGLIPNKEGESGGGIGYDGMPNAIAIELDLYKNDENNDPNGNHLAVQIPNNFILSAVHNKTNTVIMKDSVLTIVPDSSTNYYCRVEYINNSLKIYLDTTENYNQPVAELDNFIISDHILMENDNIGYLGLTSSTGRSVEVHTITHWDICSYNSSSIATGITTNESNHSLLVYPNPTDDYLNIELPNGKPYKSLQLVISDLLGKIVMKREIANAQNTMQLSVRNFEKGLYNCQIILDNQEIYHTQLIRK